MNAGGSPQQKKPTLFSHRQSPVATCPAKPTAQSHGCCRCLRDCIIMGSTISHKQHHHHQPNSTSKLEQQVAELEKEVEREKELRAMYKMRMERTQVDLRSCLQIAKDNGFLELIINSKYNQQQCLLSSNIVNVNTSPPVPVRDFDLAALIDRAKKNGWYINPQEIELGEQVGQGSTADIYRGTWRGLDVAVKCIYPDFFESNESGVAFFAQEVETLSQQCHRFVLQLLGACLDPPDHGWVVTEFLSMTLKEWLHGSGKRRKERTVPLPPFEERVAKALEIAEAMQYLHDKKPKVVHRDLKLSNIFLDDAMHVRVADFGHARFLSDEEKALTGDTGTYVYMAPEVIRCEPYDEKCDVYSFGIILNELITGEYPYIETDYNPSKIAMEVGEGKLRPALPKDDDKLEELINLIQLSWDEDASIRPSFAMIACILRKIQKRFIVTN